MGICIVPAEFQELRLDRFTMSKVSSVVDQLRVFERTAHQVRRANRKSSFTSSSMMVVIFLMSIVAIVKKEGFD